MTARCTSPTAPAGRLEHRPAVVVEVRTVAELLEAVRHPTPFVIVHPSDPTGRSTR